MVRSVRLIKFFSWQILRTSFFERHISSAFPTAVQWALLRLPIHV